MDHHDHEGDVDDHDHDDNVDDDNVDVDDDNLVDDDDDDVEKSPALIIPFQCYMQCNDGVDKA